MAAKLYNLARMTTATTGTGTITLGSAASGFLSFSSAGIANGETVSYAISDGSNSEVGRGVYTASGTTLTRVPLVSTNSNAAISLSGSAQVFITALAEDIAPPITGVIPSAAPTGQILQFSMANFVPPMTSNTAPSGTASASSSYATDTAPWCAFTYDQRGTQASWLMAGTGWISYQFPSANIVKAYEFAGWPLDNWNTRCPVGWTFQGSNDGSTWTTLDTQNMACPYNVGGSAFSNIMWITRYKPITFFCMSNTTAYLYYRLNITAGGSGGYNGVSLFKMFGVGTPTSSNPASIFTVDEFGNYSKVAQPSPLSPW